MGNLTYHSSVETFVHKYFAEFAGIFKWRQAVVGRAKADKQVRTRIGRVINVADDVTDNSFFNWPVQATGAEGFKLALYLISCGLAAVDARIVHYTTRRNNCRGQRWQRGSGEGDLTESMEKAFKQIIPEVPFVAEIRVAEAWG